MILERLDLLRRRVFVPPRTTVERNAYYLYLEVIFASVLGAAGSFNAAYILRSGGSNALVGLLSSLPAMVAMLCYIPAARFLERQVQLMPWIVRSLLVTRAGYVLILFLPFFLPRFLPELTVAILVTMTVPSVVFSTGWSPMLSEVVPPRSRATVLSWRSILASGTVAPMIYVAGRWLEHGTSTGTDRWLHNYQWMYALGFMGGAVSVYLISRIRMESSSAAGTSLAATRSREPWLATIRLALSENPGFRRIIANSFFFDLGAWLVGPLYVILFVRHLGATDGWIGLNGTLANIGVIVGYWAWRKIINRAGEARSLKIALPLASVYAFMVALWPNLSFILFAGFFINVTSPGRDLSQSMLFLDLLPPGQKYSATALYSTVMNVGAFVAPLVGVALSQQIGIPTTLLIGGTVRLAGAILFYLFPLKAPEKRLQPA